MEFSWRTILILVGLLIVAGILIDGFRRMRQARSEALGVDVVPPQSDDDEYNPELPGSGFRVIRSSVNASETNQVTTNPSANNSLSATEFNLAEDIDGRKSPTLSDEILEQPSSFTSDVSEPKLSDAFSASRVDVEPETGEPETEFEISQLIKNDQTQQNEISAEIPSMASALTRNTLAVGESTNNDSQSRPSSLSSALDSAVADDENNRSQAEADVEVDLDEEPSQSELEAIDGVTQVNALLASIQDNAMQDNLADTGTDTANERSVKAEMGDQLPSGADDSVDRQKAADSHRQLSMFERLMGNAGVQIDPNTDVGTAFGKDEHPADTVTTEQILTSLSSAVPDISVADAAELVAAADSNVHELNTPSDEAPKSNIQVELSPAVEDDEAMADPHLDGEVDGLPEIEQPLPVNYAAADAEQLANRPEPELVLVINTIATDPDGFDGEALLFLLNSCDLRFGEKNIFHRFEETDGRGCIQFSVAQSHEPGIFDPAAMAKQKFTGLTFFMSLPGASKPLEAYEAMYELAMAVSRNLKADVLDGSFSAMTSQTREHDRQLILDFERKRQLSARKAQR